jgi:hypothetical protein
MGKIARVTMFKLPKPEDQDACLEAYKKMFAEAKKVRHIPLDANRRVATLLYLFLTLFPIPIIVSLDLADSFLAGRRTIYIGV